MFLPCVLVMRSGVNGVRGIRVDKTDIITVRPRNRRINEAPFFNQTSCDPGTLCWIDSRASP